MGDVISRGKCIGKAYLSLDDIRAHIAIFGSTGTGKTTTAATLAARLAKKGIGVLILDWHNEYRHLVMELGGRIFTPGRLISPLVMNPLEIENAEGDLMEHVGYLTDIFSEVFAFSHPQAYMFREALKRVLVKAIRAGRTPTLSDVLREIERYPIRSGWDHETKMALIRRLKPLTEGQIGRALNGVSTTKISELLKGVVSIELGHFREVAAKRLFVYTLLKKIYDYRLSQGVSRTLHHIVIIEEASNIIPKALTSETLRIVERMLCELRKFGEGIVIVSQSPSSISEQALRNTAIKICHALREGVDIRVISDAMGLSEEQRAVLRLLETGMAVVFSPSIGQNLLVKIKPPEEALQPMLISDKEVAKYMRARQSNHEGELELEITLDSS